MKCVHVFFCILADQPLDSKVNARPTSFGFGAGHVGVQIQEREEEQAE